MRIAVTDPFPNKPFSAEKEFLRRIDIAGRNLGWHIIPVVTSDDILEAKPDCVLTTHEYCPKLTEIPTLGLLWSPPVFFEHCAERRKNILSMDGYLTGGPCVDEWLRKFSVENGKSVLIGPRFWPSSQRTHFQRFSGEGRRLFYAGTNWDGRRFGRRHKGLLENLGDKLELMIYGPASAWKHLPHAYYGEIPMDGISLLDRARQAGVALCLHKREHLEANLPSMRIFEAAAAGCVIIADDMPFIRENFGESVLYVEGKYGAEFVADQISAHMAWINANSASAGAMSEESHRIFTQRFCLEVLLSSLPDFLEQVRQAQGYSLSIAPSKSSDASIGYKEDDNIGLEAVSIQDFPDIEVIMRVGSRPVGMVRRAVESIAAQTYPNIGITFVAFADVPGLDNLIKKFEQRFKWMHVIHPEGNTTCRSTMLWIGLNSVKAPLLCNLDDDDCWHPNHLSSLYKCLCAHPDSGLAFSGTIVHLEDAPPFYWQTNFSALKNQPEHPIPERRKIMLLSNYDRDRLWGNDNMIANISWLARRDVFDEEVLRDPGLDYLEDVCLFRLLSTKTGFVFSGSPTAVWNLRRKANANCSWKKRARKATRRKMEDHLERFRPPGLHPRPWYVRRIGEIAEETRRIGRLLRRAPKRGFAEIIYHLGQARRAWKRSGRKGLVDLFRGRDSI